VFKKKDAIAIGLFVLCLIGAWWLSRMERDNDARGLTVFALSSLCFLVSLVMWTLGNGRQPITATRAAASACSL
jgi:hypothetical protein